MKQVKLPHNKLILLFALLLTKTVVFAQSEKDIYLQAGAADAQTYLANYLRPFFNGLGYGFTGGWYQTAATHKFLGFDVQVMANVAVVPNSELTWIFDPNEFENIRLSNPSDNRFQTVFGSDKKSDRPEVTFVDNQGNELVRITSAPGALDMKNQIGFNGVPVPMVQGGIGLIKNTDLKLRFVPTIRFAQGEFRMSGFGLQHNVKQWIPLLQQLNMDVAVLGAFHSARLLIDLSEKDDPVTQNNEGEFRISGLTLQGIISKTIQQYTVFAGAGYARSGSVTKIKGEYPIDDSFNPIGKDPINLSYADNSINLTIGGNVRIGIITLNASFAFQKYPVANLGVGVTVR